MTGDPTSEPVTPDVPAEPAEGRAAYAISQLYYYVAAVAGVGFVIGGLVGFLFGLRALILPDEFQVARDGIRGMLFGLSFALPGLLVMWWHLRQARRREGGRAPGAFWGTALYFHMVALVALLFVMGGTVGILASATNAVLPDCESVPPPQAILEVSEDSPPQAAEAEVCYPEPAESARSALDAAIFVLVAGPIMWWHLRQGRSLTAPPPDAVP